MTIHVRTVPPKIKYKDKYCNPRTHSSEHTHQCKQKQTTDESYRCPSVWKRFVPTVAVFLPKPCTEGVFKVRPTELDDEADEHKKSLYLLILLEHPSVYFGSSNVNLGSTLFLSTERKTRNWTKSQVSVGIQRRLRRGRWKVVRGATMSMRKRLLGEVSWNMGRKQVDSEWMESRDVTLFKPCRTTGILNPIHIA